LCGRTLARSHARTGDPAVIAGYMGRSAAFDDALASFAMAYAEQTVKDHAALVKAKGVVQAEAPSKVARPARKTATKRDRKSA
jgi:thiamine monophosphate kinase